MHLSSSIISFIGAAIFLVVATEASPSNKSHQIVAGVNFNHLNPLQAMPQMHQDDIQPVSYLQRRDGKRRRLFSKKNRFDGNNKKKHRHHKKRDHATTLKLLRAALNNYKKDIVTPPPVELIQMEQQLQQPAPAAIPPPPPAVIQPQMFANPIIPVQTPTAPPPATAEVTPPANLEDANPPVPDLSSGQTVQAVDPNNTVLAPETGNEETESTKPPAAADIEEDDLPDPEEDPDDVDDPPMVNGVPVYREE